MNLVNRLPDFVELDGEHYKINTDFRVWIYVEKLLISGGVSPAAKAAKMLELCYQKRLPPDISAAVRLLLQFYCGGTYHAAATKGFGSAKRIYDFEQDAGLFYAAFLQVYGMDLTQVQLHWWKFLELFYALDGDCKLCKVMHWRAVDLSKISDKGQKDFYRKMKRCYRICNDRDGKESDQFLAEVLSEAVK